MITEKLFITYREKNPKKLRGFNIWNISKKNLKCILEELSPFPYSALQGNLQKVSQVVLTEYVPKL